ncbi:hypothetical protein ARMGADRAFT_1035685 [Armillaria gallica]|uniref:Uncharacterized protein n=1 Tax=Armillaria gallica TaxID=47427 RepID=A0A2H3CT72_ARMGA|nr:hypothetical protein ARMGADRAFT_1035685 [Armillaria gallica]
MPNQHLPLVPEELIRPRLEKLWRMEGGITDTVLCDELQKYFTSLSSFKRKKDEEAHGLFEYKAARPHSQNDHRTYQGVEGVCLLLLASTMPSLHGCRETIKEWSHAMEPTLVARQFRKDMVWKVFYCAGANDLWCIDQHDKWKYQFGLCLHACVDPFSGVFKWMKIWWNNSNPVLIGKYYLDVVEVNGSQAQTFLRQWADPELCNTVQHRWMAEKMNIPSEIVWSVFHTTFSFGYEGLLQHGVDQGWYNPKKRHNRKIAHPNGIPLLVKQALERFNTQDYKCTQEFMNELGNPEITQDCIWNIYLALLRKFHDHRIIAEDEWHMQTRYEATISILWLSQDKEVGGTLSHKESGESDEEEFEISGEVPNLEMSLINFMQHMGM